MADVLIGAVLGVIFVIAGGLLFLYWLGWLPKKQTVTLPASWPTDLYWVVEEQYRRSPFNPDSMANALNRRTDPVEDALSQAGKYDEQRQYERAKAEITAAYEDRRLPALWAVSIIRAYRDAYALAAELEAARIRQGTERLRNGQQPPRTVHAEVVRPQRPRHSQLPN